ncbi:hypothetical protein QR680_014745 [Steinernema hermaphroditum]|uniref:Peptidase S1 domain-containing protein n=1 Tax=Steinernema hermaphroditum TaxID=289476 RepID=A0AA39ICL8_9BILA|nr:hypothetical protein QR680_014745 [Steinernema hermaphroditum]
MNIRTLLFLASAFFLCLYGAPMVLDELDTSELVFGGTRAQLGQFPMQVFISFMNTAAKQPDLCGGTLLSTTHVLTAAHCAVFMGAPHKVMVGSTNRNDTSSKAQWRNIARIRPHPGYKRGKIAVYNDVAVLELDKPVKLSSAVKIVKIVRNDAQLLKQKTATVVGFGIHGYQGKKYSLHEHLLYTQVGLIAFEYCNGMWGNTLKEKEMVCAGSKGRGAGFVDLTFFINSLQVHF